MSGVTMNVLIPREPRRSSDESVRAMARMTPAYAPPETHAFVPFRTQPSPSRMAWHATKDAASGTGIGLRHGKGTKQVSTSHRLQKTLFLLLIPPSQDHLRRKGGMDAEQDSDGGIHARDLLQGHEVRERIETQPVVCLWNHQAEEAQCTELTGQRRLKVRVAVPGGAVRRDLTLGELAR